MDRAETVSTTLTDIYAQQYTNVAKMRAQLTAFNGDDPSAAKKAISNITVLRVYHQIARIIRYTEMMDNIEDKIYSAIDNSLADLDDFDPSTWVKLVALQEKLQRCMIESHKLLEPYLSNELFESIQLEEKKPDESFATLMLDAGSRQKIRDSASAVLAALDNREDQ